MKRLVSVISAFLLAALAFAQDAEQPKTGWVFTPMPDFSYDTDLGLHLGAYSNFFYYGDGSSYPNFLHHAAVLLTYTTKGSWHFHTMAESKTLIPGIRLSGSFTVREVLANNFYGFNGPAAPFDESLELNAATRRAYYTNRRSVIRAVATAEGKISGRFNWMGGLVFRSCRLGDFDLSNYDSGNSLYLTYYNNGLIRDDEFAGGSSLEAKAGFFYDSRDIELVPTKGIYGELYLVSNHDLSHGRYSYGQIVGHFRQYLSLIPGTLVFAYHLALQHQIWGEQPFYNITELATPRYQYEEYSGLGSRYSIRGYRYNRIAAAGYAWSNFELRTRIASFHLWNQHMELVLNPFMDAAVITRHYRLEEQKAAPGLWQETKSPLMLSAGLGGKFQMNTNFIMSLEVGRGFDPQIGDWMVGMASTYTF